MGTIKLINPTIIDIDDILSFKKSLESECLNNIDFNILNISNPSEWLEIISNKKLQIKKFQNILSLFIAKRIEDEKFIGIVLIKKNLNYDNPLDSHIKYYIDKKDQNKGYESQILNISIVEASKMNIDEIIVAIPKNNLKENELLLNHNAILKKQLIDKDNNFINRFLLKK